MALLNTSNPGNFSNNITEGEYCRDEPMKYNVLSLYIMIISVLGIILNVFVLLVFCLHKKACTVAEIYLSNLAAADLLLTVFLPFWAQNTANQYKWQFGEPLCKLVTGAIFMNACSSIYFIVIISIDRYLALVHPLSHGSMRRPRNAKLVCVVVWGLALVMTCPTIIYQKVGLQPNTVCYNSIPHRVLYTVLIIILTFIIPIGFILFFTVKICKAVRNRSIKNLNSNMQVQEQKATILILSVLVAFLICWVPHHTLKVVTLLLYFNNVGGCKIGLIMSLLRIVFGYLAFFNSVLNPILYVTVGKNFQKKVKELFTLRCDNKDRLSFSLISSRLSRHGNTDITCNHNT